MQQVAGGIREQGQFPQRRIDSVTAMSGMASPLKSVTIMASARFGPRTAGACRKVPSPLPSRIVMCPPKYADVAISR